MHDLKLLDPPLLQPKVCNMLSAKKMYVKGTFVHVREVKYVLSLKNDNLYCIVCDTVQC